jgi:hypothetical protein
MNCFPCGKDTTKKLASLINCGTESGRQPGRLRATDEKGSKIERGGKTGKEQVADQIRLSRDTSQF